MGGLAEAGTHGVLKPCGALIEAIANDAGDGELTRLLRDARAALRPASSPLDPARTPDSNGEPRQRLVGHSPNIIWRAKEVIQRLLATGFRALASDHSMSQYALKLRVYAEQRNSRSGLS